MRVALIPPAANAREKGAALDPARVDRDRRDQDVGIAAHPRIADVGEQPPKQCRHACHYRRPPWFPCALSLLVRFASLAGLSASSAPSARLGSTPSGHSTRRASSRNAGAATTPP